MASTDMFNIDTDPPSQYTQYDVPQPPFIPPTIIGENTTIVTTINGASGPNVNFTSTIGYEFTGNAGGGVVMSVSDATLARTSIGAAGAGVNTDITELNGASQVDVSSDYKVNGTQVVTDQQAAIPNAAGGVTVDTEARAAINALLAVLRVHGLIAT